LPFQLFRDEEANMTSVRKFLGVLVLGLLFAAPAAIAADIVTFHLDSVSGNQLGGYFVYPYYADINGGPISPVICDDFYGREQPGDSWPAYRTYLSSMDVSNTKFQNFQLYQELAWLANQALQTNDPLQQGEINWALWEMTSPGLVENDPSVQLGIANWISQADIHYLDGPIPAWTELVIYTPVNKVDQEIIAIANPEPGTILLLGSGIVGLWSQRKRIF
jgi:hypothetical protein